MSPHQDPFPPFASCACTVQVYEGLLRSTPDRFPDAASLLRLWRNELLRCLADRLISEGDRELFNTKLGEVVNARYLRARTHGEVCSCCRISIAETYSHAIRCRFQSAAPSVMANPCLFGDYKTVGQAEPPADQLRLYEDLGAYEGEALTVQRTAYFDRACR